MKYLVATVAVLLAGTAFAGPIRDRIAARWENRPGVIVPKVNRGGCCGGSAGSRSSCAGSCASCPACAECVGGSCPLPASGVVARPVAPVIRYVQVCENGKCRLVPVRE